MDPEAFTTGLFKWVPRAGVPHQQRLPESVAPLPSAMVETYAARPRELCELEQLFQTYGIRYFTAAKIAELGFTASTLLDMKDGELDEMMNSLAQIFRWELLVGERYGVKAAVRAERRRLDEEDYGRHHFLSCDTTNTLDALSQEELSEEPVQQQKEAAGSGGGQKWEEPGVKKRLRGRTVRRAAVEQDTEYDNNYDDEDESAEMERQREHPFIVTEPGEVARGKKNGLDYLFHLYEQCRDFLLQVQSIAKQRGEKCPSKVTNQVFRYAKKAGASYINKPKMRHYVHCYALHCLDEQASNVLRRVFKERGENVGAWRQACYKPLVGIAARQGWDIDAIFNANPRLSIWYVPTKLRQLCHAERSSASASSSVSADGEHPVPF